MGFVIRDGDWYLKRENGKYDKTKDVREAVQFDSEEKCNNVIRSQLSKKLKNGYAWRSFQLPESKRELPQEEEWKPEQIVWVVKTTDGYFGFQENRPVFNVCLENAFQFKKEESCNRVLQSLKNFGKEGTAEYCVVGQGANPWNKDLS